MYTVGLKVIPVFGEALEQERHQRHFPAARDFAEHGLELFSVVLAVVRGNAHPDEQHAGLAPPGGIDRRLQVAAHGVEARSAQPIVRAEREDQHGRAMRLEHDGEAVAPAQRGLAADAGIDYLIIEFFRAQALREQIHPSLLVRQAVSRRKAVAVDHEGRGRSRRRRQRQRARRQCTGNDVE